MRVGNSDINIKEAIDFSLQDEVLLKRRENGFLLSDYQVSVLKRSGLGYEKYSNLSTLLFDIEEILTTDYDEELDSVGMQIAEMVYYKDTNK